MRDLENTMRMEIHDIVGDENLDYCLQRSFAVPPSFKGDDDIEKKLRSFVKKYQIAKPEKKAVKQTKREREMNTQFDDTEGPEELPLPAQLPEDDKEL